MTSKKLLPAIFILLLSACAPDPVATGHYRATLQLPGGELPFSLYLEQADSGWTATVVNGAERMKIEQVSVSPDAIQLVMPAFNNRINATRAGEGFAGELVLVKRGGKKQIIPFNAQPSAEYRFFAEPHSDHINVDGRWAVSFVDDDGVSTAAVAEFEQDGQTVTGTFLTATGDYRFLAGEVNSGQLLLSTFDGAHAFLFRAQLDEQQQLQGDFWSGTAWHESWTANRDDHASLPDADTLTQFVGERLAFEFPDTNGELVSLDDARFQGKVVLVTLAGSWCPNCHDEAAFMAPYYRRLKDQGFEVVGLMFEHLDQFDQAAKQVDAFRDKFDIGYTLLVAGSSDKKRASATMQALNRVYAFPTTLFIDRSGQVRRVHTGFNGPGTGEHYDRLIASIDATVQTLLAEK